MLCCLSDERLRAMLAEDVPYGDLTTRSLGIGKQPAAMVMYARRDMWLCGTEEAARLIELAGAQVQGWLASGSRVGEGTKVLRAQGSAESLHLAWKTAQTLMEYLSGIASCAGDILQRLRDEGFELSLACTRKNLPGNRQLQAKAVMAGGAVAHRLGLSETLLVFPEHRAFIDKSDLPELFRQLRHQAPEKKLVAEASSLTDALWLAQCGEDVLQLERFSPTALSECKAALAAQNLSPLVAPAGGVVLDNALAYARAGADFLISSAPYFAAPRDIKVRLLRA